MPGTKIEPDSVHQDVPALSVTLQQERPGPPLKLNCAEAEADPKSNLCLHALIEEQALRSPDETAVVFEHESLTYKELNAHADQLADSLKAVGVEREVCVGLCVERSLEMIVGILAILKAGGAYLPIETTAPLRRIEFILQDAAPKVVLTQTNLLERLPDGVLNPICLDSFDWTARQTPLASGVRGRPTDLAYVIYTSGST